MEPIQEHILIVDGRTDPEPALDAGLDSMGYRVERAATASEGSARLKTRPPTFLIVNLRTPGIQQLLDTLASLRPDTPVMALAETPSLHPAMVRWKGVVHEFIRTPVDPVELEVAVMRIRTLVDLRRRLAAADPVAARDPGDDDHFSFIKQTVKSLSLFMGQIASDAQDGLRYFDEMPYFMAIHSSTGRVLAANPAYKAHLGDRVGRDCWEIYTGTHGSMAACPVGLAIRNGRITTTRAEVRYASGARVPVFVHTAPIFSGDGRIELVVEVFAGTREIESMAREIGTTQQRYRQLFDAVPNYIAVLDRQLRLTAFNQRFLDDFGFKTGRKFFDLFRPVGPPPDKGPIGRTLEDGMPHQGEVVLFSPEGDQLNLLAWTSPIKTAAGKLIQIVVIFTDVTEVRRLQDNLTQLGLMISTITHTLKGSLTGLDAGLYMIDKGFYRNHPGRVEEGLDVAKLMAERIRKVVRDILYYAKERDLEIERVDAGGFAADVAASVQRRILGADIRFHCRFDPGAGHLEIDPGLIRASLINIMDNAAEACIEDPSDRTHKIEFTVDGDVDHVDFTITDNGVGMAADQVRNIFKLFWSSKGKKGTGLGLFITNKVVRKHGGTITVTADPDGSTAFIVRLPRTIRTGGG